MNLVKYKLKKKMETKVKRDEKEVKEWILRKYFNQFKGLELDKVEFKIIFIDNKLLKFVGLPKVVYRDYYVQIRFSYFNETAKVSGKDKEKLKKVL